MTLVGECGKDDGGVWGSARAAGGGGVRVPLRRDGRFANRPYEVWGVGEATGVWVGVRRAAPLWIPAFAGTTMGGCGAAGGVGGGVRVPLRRDGRFANRPYDGESGKRWGTRWGCGAAGGGGWGRDFRFDGAGLLGIGCGEIVGWLALTLLSRATRLGQSSNLPRP